METQINKKRLIQNIKSFTDYNLLLKIYIQKLNDDEADIEIVEAMRLQLQRLKDQLL